MLKKVTSKGSIFGKVSEIKKVIKKNLQDELLNIAYEHFLDGFPESNTDKGGRQTDSSTTGWVERKKKYEHPTLNKTGALMASIDIDKNSVYTDIEYASYHNNGDGWLPKREFIGASKKLIIKSIKYIKERINKLLE